MMQCGWKASLVVFAWLVSGAAGAFGETDEAADEPPRTVTLDALLTLPDALPVETSRRGGATRAEWRARFEAAEAELRESQAALDESMAKLGDLASKTSGWKVAAPGAPLQGDDNSPMDYGLRQEIRRRREEVESSERELRELVIEANLAGVPKDWQDSD